MSFFLFPSLLYSAIIIITHRTTIMVNTANQIMSVFVNLMLNIVTVDLDDEPAECLGDFGVKCTC